MRKIFLRIFIFVLVLALTIVSTVLGVNIYNSNGRLAEAETKIAQLEEALNTALDSNGEPIALPDLSNYTTEKCNNTDEEGSLIILFPCDGEVVSKEFGVFGIAQGFFENNVSLRISIDSEIIEERGILYPSSDIGAPGMLLTSVDLSDLSSGESVTLRFYQESPRDGEEEKIVEVDVVIE